MLINQDHSCIEKESRLRLLNACKKKQTISSCASSDIMQEVMARISVFYYLWPKYRYIIHSSTYWIVTAIFVTCLTFFVTFIPDHCHKTHIYVT